MTREADPSAAHARPTSARHTAGEPASANRTRGRRATPGSATPGGAASAANRDGPERGEEESAVSVPPPPKRSPSTSTTDHGEPGAGGSTLSSHLARLGAPDAKAAAPEKADPEPAPGAVPPTQGGHPYGTLTA